jgi:hypothetical protein
MSGKPLSKPNPGWFPKGACGNRNGRPANRRVPQDPNFKVLSEKIRVNGPDGPRDMLPEEAVEWTTFLAALTGKSMAIRDVTKWMKEYRAGLAKDGPKAAPQQIELVAAQNPDNADEALQLLEIAAPNASMEVACIPFLLEPWSVQAALSRRRGGSRLTDKERDDVRRLTSDPGSLRWPRGTDK